MGPIRLVATDLDGTLLRPDATVGERTRAAIAACRGAGVPVVPITARPPHATWHLTDPAGLADLAVCANGAVVCDARTHEVLQVDLLTASVAGRLVEQLRAAVPGLLLGIDGPDRFVHEPGFLDGLPAWEEGVTEVPDILDAVGEGVVKVVGRRAGWSAEELVATVEGVLGEEAHATSSGGVDWVELSAFGVTKAHGLASVCDRLGIPTSAVAAVGDNLNDLSMLAAAGLPCAVANARREVLAVADRVLPSNAEEGVATLLEEVAAAAGG